MVNYEQALKKAKKLKRGIDYCVEHENAYMFGAESERLSIGGDGPVFILKETGAAVGATVYYDSMATDVVKDAFKV